MTNAIGLLFVCVLWPLVWYSMFPADNGTLSWGLALSSGLLAAVWFPIASALARKLEKAHKTKDDSMAYGWDWLVRPIQTEQPAGSLLDELAKGWYALAGLQAFGMIGRAFMGQPVNYVSDLVLQALGGYLLPRSRSRVLAVVLFLYGIGSVVAAHLGFLEARNVFRTIFQLLVGFRGVQATMVYHSKAGSVPIWKHVAMVWIMLFLATLILIPVFAFVRGFGEALFARKISGDILGAMHYMTLLAVHLMTKRRFPMVVRPLSAMGGTAV